MDALRFSFNDGTLQLCRIDIPKISEPSDILIKVAFASICGTDLHILKGHYPCKQSSAITLGHEIAGVVSQVGHNVVDFQEGDRVVLDPNSGCHQCAFCHAGMPHFCKVGCVSNTLGIYKDGGWAEYVLCPEEHVYKLAVGIPLERAVLTEPISCMIHGWDILNPIPVGSKILLLGAGIEGHLWACALHLQGHRNVTVSEPIENKLKQIRKLNTGYKLITPSQLRKCKEEEPEKCLFDVVVDCSGSPAAIELGISILNNGGKFCVYGVAPPLSKISVSPFDIFWKELKILGAKVNPFTFKKAIGLIEALGDRYLNYTTLGMKTFSLRDYKEAIDSMKKGTIVKAVFKIV